MTYDPLSAIALLILCASACMYPIGFMFGVCSQCCQSACQWFLEFNRCMRVANVGTQPQTGTHRRLHARRRSVDIVSTTPFASTVFVSCDNDNGPVAFEIRRVAQKRGLQVSFRMADPSLVINGSSGVAVYRFQRAPTGSTPEYDVAGPSWHLEVELNYRRDVNALGGIESQSTTTDESGQVKLVVSIVFGASNPTYESSAIDIFPVNAQRIVPLLQGAVSVVADGNNPPGVASPRIAGIATKETSLAVLLRSACVSQITQKWLTEEETVIRFLNGETIALVGNVAGTQQYELTVLPNSTVCDLPASAVGHGITLGAYPEVIYADAPSHLAQEEIKCGASGLTLNLLPAREEFGGCVLSWQHSTYRRNQTTISPINQIITPVAFWPGSSLLWNLENGPFRTSFSSSGWVFRLAGEQSQVDPYWLSPFSSSCRQGFVSLGGLCLPSQLTVSWEDITIPAKGLPQFGFAGDLCLQQFFPLVDLEIKAASQDISVFSPTFFGNFAGRWGGQQVDFVYYGVTSSAEEYEPFITRFSEFFGESGAGQVSGGASFLVAGNVDRCTDPPSAKIIDSVMFTGPGQWGWQRAGSETDSGGLAYAVAVCDPGYSNEYPIEQEGVFPRNFFRSVCGGWSPPLVPSAGGEVTRTCTLQDTLDASGVISTQAQTITITQSRNLIGRVILPGVVQEGQCRLYALRDTRRLRPDGLEHRFSPTSDEPCGLFVPVFGATSGTNCGAATDTTVPCPAGCVPTVTVSSGGQWVSARYIESGDKAGLIAVTKIGEWGAGKTASLVVACGESEITVSLSP
jgi:hypothetical protein